MGEIMRAYVMIGPPCSGKTTYIREVLKIVPNQQVVCPDDIRIELTGDAADQTRNSEVWRIAYRRAEEALRSGKVLIFDATNAKQLDRMALLDHLRSIMGDDGFIKGIWLKTPLNVCKKRNTDRDRQIPEHALERMHRQLVANPPRLYEGFSQIYVPGW